MLWVLWTTPLVHGSTTMAFAICVGTALTTSSLRWSMAYVSRIEISFSTKHWIKKKFLRKQIRRATHVREILRQVLFFAGGWVALHYTRLHRYISSSPYQKNLKALKSISHWGFTVGDNIHDVVDITHALLESFNTRFDSTSVSEVL